MCTLLITLKGIKKTRFNIFWNTQSAVVVVSSSSSSSSLLFSRVATLQRRWTSLSTRCQQRPGLQVTSTSELKLMCALFHSLGDAANVVSASRQQLIVSNIQKKKRRQILNMLYPCVWRFYKYERKCRLNRVSLLYNLWQITWIPAVLFIMVHICILTFDLVSS